MPCLGEKKLRLSISSKIAAPSCFSTGLPWTGDRWRDATTLDGRAFTQPHGFKTRPSIENKVTGKRPFEIKLNSSIWKNRPNSHTTYIHWPDCFCLGKSKPRLLPGLSGVTHSFGEDLFKMQRFRCALGLKSWLTLCSPTLAHNFAKVEKHWFVIHVPSRKPRSINHSGWVGTISQAKPATKFRDFLKIIYSYPCSLIYFCVYSFIFELPNSPSALAVSNKTQWYRIKSQRNAKLGSSKGGH